MNTDADGDVPLHQLAASLLLGKGRCWCGARLTKDTRSKRTRCTHSDLYESDATTTESHSHDEVKTLLDEFHVARTHPLLPLMKKCDTCKLGRSFRFGHALLRLRTRKPDYPLDSSWVRNKVIDEFYHFDRAVLHARGKTLNYSNISRYSGDTSVNRARMTFPILREPPFFLTERIRQLKDNGRIEVMWKDRHSEKERREKVDFLRWTHLAQVDADKGSTKATLYNLCATSPGVLHSRFLDKNTLFFLPHSITFDPLTVRKWKVRTPEKMEHNLPQTGSLFPTDVPTRYFIKISLEDNSDTVCDVSYCDISPLVKRPHCFTCCTVYSRNENSNQDTNSNSSWMLLAGEFFHPENTSSSPTYLGVAYLDVRNNEATLRGCLGLSQATEYDVVASIELAMDSDTVLVALRYGGVFVLCQGCLIKHIPTDGMQAPLARCLPIDTFHVAVQWTSGVVADATLLYTSQPWATFAEHTARSNQHLSTFLLGNPSPALHQGVDLPYFHPIPFQHFTVETSPLAEEEARANNSEEDSSLEALSSIMRYVLCIANMEKLHDVPRSTNQFLLGTYGGEIYKRSIRGQPEKVMAVNTVYEDDEKERVRRERKSQSQRRATKPLLPNWIFYMILLYHVVSTFKFLKKRKSVDSRFVFLLPLMTFKDLQLVIVNRTKAISFQI